jgi:hypothetical protein
MAAKAAGGGANGRKETVLDIQKWCGACARARRRPRPRLQAEAAGLAKRPSSRRFITDHKGPHLRSGFRSR